MLRSKERGWRLLDISFEDLGKFQMKKVNPFQGLVIDADAWRDAHTYHANHMRLHLLAFHHVGILEGLGVTANTTPDLSVIVKPGIAVDPEGNVIIVGQEQPYRLQTQKKALIYLVIQFREVAGEPYQPPNGGQPTRMLDAYRIQERDKLPTEPYLELARIDFDPAKGGIGDAKSPQHPGKNEIDLRQRISAAPVVVEKPTVIEKPVVLPGKTETISRPVETLVVGHAVVSGDDKQMHVAGLQNALRTFGHQNGLPVTLEENISLEQDLNRYLLVYLSGNTRFDLPVAQQTALSRYLQSGGVIFGEGCSETPEEVAARGAKDFGLAFNQLAGQLKRRLEIVKRGHPMLSVFHVFSDVPPGAEAGMLMEGGHMVYSGSDYGCAWQGGHQNKPLSRELIRTAFEMGDNVLAFARMMKSGQS